MGLRPDRRGEGGPCSSKKNNQKLLQKNNLKLPKMETEKHTEDQKGALGALRVQGGVGRLSFWPKRTPCLEAFGGPWDPQKHQYSFSKTHIGQKGGRQGTHPKTTSILKRKKRDEASFCKTYQAKSALGGPSGRFTPEWEGFTHLE